MVTDFCYTCYVQYMYSTCETFLNVSRMATNYKNEYVARNTVHCCVCNKTVSYDKITLENDRIYLVER